MHGRGHVWQGVCMAGGMHGGGHVWQGVCGGEPCMLGGGHAWWRACIAGGMCGRGHVWRRVCMVGDMHGRGACVVGGMHGGVCVWQILLDTVNERAVRILLEFTLVLVLFSYTLPNESSFYTQVRILPRGPQLLRPKVADGSKVELWERNDLSVVRFRRLGEGPWKLLGF